MTDFLPQELIVAKRDGRPLSDADIRAFVAGITDGSVTDAQISAFAMATFFRGMEPEEGAALALAMRDSGDVIDWTARGFDADAPITDKHSTGGVGDKISLMLAPIVAAAGGLVPMISGRGLGHSGGTLDKLESIKGYDAFPTIESFTEIVRNVGCSIIGQTADLAPADRRFYGIRDVTGTVESVPLITASILSKKLAAGLNSLVMDVKFGNGAFMKTYEEAEALAVSLTRVANAAGTPTRALITDMNWVLGRSAGNAIEVLEAIDFLKNPKKAEPRQLDLTLDLAAHMLFLAGIDDSEANCRAKAEDVLFIGLAAETFSRMVVAQGGPSGLMDNPAAHLDLGPVERTLTAKRGGYAAAMDTRAIGMAVVALGGGRTEPRQRVDHRVGYGNIVLEGTKVAVGDPLATVYAASEDAADRAAQAFEAALTIEDRAPKKRPIVAERVDA